MVTRAQKSTPGRSPSAAVRWLGPLPLWAVPSPVGLRLQDAGHAAQPAILRFDHDDFMQEYIDTLQQEPERLGEWIAQPETWRAPMASPTAAQAETLETSRVAFLYDKTRRLAEAKRPSLPTAINLQAAKSRFRKKPLVAKSAISDEQLPLKLYQAGQKRHYLVTASLICEQAGLPDCVPQLLQQEKPGFVIRRLLPPDDNHKAPLNDWDEYAFVPGSKKNSWQRIGRHHSDAARKLVHNEELLPMFPVSFQHKACAESRRLWGGAIPVSRREQWVGAEIAGDASAVGSGASGTANVGRSLPGFLFQADVAAPWKMLLEQAEFKKTTLKKKFDNFGSNASQEANDRKRLLRTARDEIQTGSWYVLLDFAKFLKTHLPDVWQALKGEKAFSTLNNGEQDLLTALRNSVLSSQLAWETIAGKPDNEATTTPETLLLQLLQYIALWNQQSPGSVSDALLDSLLAIGWGSTIPAANAPYKFVQLKWTLADALLAAEAAGPGLEAVETTFIRFNENGIPIAVDSNWPRFLFPLADPDPKEELNPPIPAVAAAELTGLSGLERRQTAVDVLAEMVERLLPASEPVDELIDNVPLGDSREAWFVVRCVYQRPHCGPLFAPLLSAATQKFQMAPFFDPDAPARPVRIPMPLDISPAGLRKYQKNTGFVISDMLCGKIKGIRKMSFADLVLSVLPWPFHKDLPEPGSGTCKDGDGNGLGMICSLSIPIVTLCALILMMIMVALFDLFFRWIPYLFICLPIPGLKGKKLGGG